MKEYSNGIKGAAIVMHQMFLVLMVCSLYGIGYNMRMHYGGLGILSTLAILGLVGSFVMLAFLTGIIGRRSADDNHIYLQGVDKIYTDVELLIFIGFIYVMLYLCRNISQMRFEFSGLLVAAGTLAYIVDLVFLLIYLSIVRRAKDNTLFTYSVIYIVGGFLKRVITSGKDPRLCTRKARERIEIQEAIEAIASGALDTKLDVEKFHGQERDIAAAVNNIRAGLSDAIMDRIRNERMKADLITNVSHDIKTPLTSIINYVDLLQKAQTEEERKEYLEVLDRQSQRLKKLIDDLMDMSKASTGNMTVDITRVDAVEAVNQALGEFADKLDRAMLSPVFRHDDASVPMMADGRLVWRVLSNLLGNAVKYAMPGTRLYIDLSQMGGKVLLSVKNISREELNIGADELMERFVRGDGSRNTEGSGLGLNIAKSLMELQKGELQLLVYGDLFKVTLIFPGI